VDFANCGYLYEETLTDITTVVEGGWPAGPSFFHSLGSLVEAVIIHEHVYFDALNYSRHPRSGEDITSHILQSEFAKHLIADSAIEPFPVAEEVNKHLEAIGKEYSVMDFWEGSVWDPTATFTIAIPGRELNALQIALDLTQVPDVLSGHYLIDSPEYPALGGPVTGILENSSRAVLYLLDKSSGKPTAIENAGVMRAVSELGFSPADIRHIDALNHRARAHVDLGRELGINIYPPLRALSHQFGGVRASNTEARRLYDDLESKFRQKLSVTEDTEVGSERYARVSIPPLVQIVLQKCGDNPRALGVEICHLRHSHREFRNYLTGFERAWKSATTRQERLKLRSEFGNAWETLSKGIDQPSTRLLYQLWDIIKKPTDLLQGMGDFL